MQRQEYQERLQHAAEVLSQAPGAAPGDRAGGGNGAPQDADAGRETATA
jgi:hypothetical protein